MSDGTDPRTELQLDAFAVDVRDVLHRNVASLYSHLVTRPTGRAVRMAIEAQLAELPSPVLSLVDLSSVAILDYSCADEVVAKLLLGRCDGRGTRRDVFFIFQGLREHHRDPVREVLARHELAAVIRPQETGAFELLGTCSPAEVASWRRVEELRRIPSEELDSIFPSSERGGTVRGLVERGLVFRHPLRGDLHALSALARTGP
jgi:hypothetical protein